MHDPTTLKTCTGPCGQTKPRTEFYAAKNKEGLRAECKTCTNARNEAWKIANPGKRKKIANAYAKRARQIPEKRDVFNAKALEWKAAHPERVAVHRATDAAKAKTSETRKSSHAQANKRWFAKRPTYRRTASHKRRALIKGAEVLDTDIDIARLYLRDKGICSLCHKRVKKALQWPDLMCATIDHIVPLTKGGTHSWANVALAHHRCNTLKKNRDAVQQMRLF